MSNLNQFSSGLLKFNTSQRIGSPEVSTQSAAFQSDTQLQSQSVLRVLCRTTLYIF